MLTRIGMGLAGFSLLLGLAAAASAPAAKNDATEVAELIEAARAKAAIPTEEHLRSARNAATAAIQGLDQHLAGTPNRNGLWSDMRLDALEAELAKDKPDTKTLSDVYHRLCKPRWQMPSTVTEEVRLALMTYIDRLDRVQRGKSGDDRERLDQLATAWKEFQDTHSAESFARLSEAYEWLAHDGEATELVEAIHRQASYPNHIVRVANAYLSAAMARDVVNEKDVNENIQGARISGHISGKGKVTVEVPQDPREVQLQLHFRGHANSNFRMTKGIASMTATAGTDVTSVEPVYLDANGFKHEKPKTCATNHTQPQCVSLNLRSAIVRRLATPIARRVASREVAARDPQIGRTVADSFNQKVNFESDIITFKLDQMFQLYFWKPLYDQDVAGDVKMSADAHRASCIGTFATPWQLAAPGPPPQNPGGMDPVCYEVHESLINNTQGMWAGKRITEFHFHELLYDNYGLERDAEDAVKRRQIPEVVTYADEDPLRVAFRNGRVELRVRLKSFEHEGQKIEGGVWTVSTAYTPTATADGLSFVRDEKIRIEPTDDPKVETLRATLERFMIPTLWSSSSRKARAKSMTGLHAHRVSIDNGWLLASSIVIPPTKSAATTIAKVDPPKVAKSAITKTDKAASSGDPLRDRFEKIELFLQFQGKGSRLPYDGGVISVAYPRIPAMQSNRVAIGGNSSGSVLAIYYSNYGLSKASVDYAAYRLTHGDTTAIQRVEDTNAKAVKMLHGQKTEAPHFALREYVSFALGVAKWEDCKTLEEIAARSTIKSRLPVLVITANKDVLDNRVPGLAFSGFDYKVFDPKTYSVSWKPTVYEFYKQHPEQFKRDQPNLKLGDTPYIGKAATFFVNQPMFDLLSKIPAEERMGDLRLMTNPQDMLVAIKASVSEPSYFDPVVEPNPSKLMTGDKLGDTGNTKTRVYCGGYIMSLGAQDVRRMLPAVRVMGTGWTRLPAGSRNMLKAWFLQDMEPVMNLNSWWADVEMIAGHSLDAQLKSNTLTADEFFRVGQQVARHCLESEAGIAEFVERPYYDHAAKNAIWPAGTPDSVKEAPLETLRGLGPLLDKQ